MATANPTGEKPVTVSVPPVCAERLRAEARDHLANAAANVAANVAEAAEWARRHQDRARLDGSDLPRLHAADRIWSQVRDAERGEPVKVNADRAAVAALLRSCCRDLADDIRDELGGRWSPRSMIALADELTAWAIVFRDSGLPTAPDTGKAV